MSWVALGIGSNIHPLQNISQCLDALLLKFKDLNFSSVFESGAVGFSGNNFLNMVVTMQTDMPLQKLIAVLKTIEDDLGRDRTQAKFSSRTMDIDILVFGDTIGKHEGIVLPRPEICENAYVLWPLSQLAKQKKHPSLGQTYGELWDSFDKKKQKLWPIDFSWHGRVISARSDLQKG
jgi:2-amino-4-hydroxy-6-hydroxymethyldihydropteridine diphosphokinase